MPTLRQIARAAGVSASTVSLVLNDRDGVSPDKRQAVYDAIDQLEMKLGRTANSRSKRSMYGENLRSERSKRSNDAPTLSFMVLHPPVPSSYYVFSQVLQGIQAAAEANLIQLRLIPNDAVMGEDHLAYQILSDEKLRPDGLIMFGARESEPLLAQAQYLNVPCVVLGRDVSKYRVSGLGRDEVYWGYAATEYLLELGHEAIAFIGGEEGFDYVQNRLKGYQQALKANKIKLKPEWVRLGDGVAGTHGVLDDAIREITAIIYVNDQYAAAGIEVLREAGARIPQDISVLSFDNTDFARKAGLTSISYEFFQEGQWAIKMLIDQIRFPALDQVHVYFKAELVKRRSCAPR